MAPRVDPLIPPLVTTSRAAARLDCSRTWIHALIADDRLTGVRVGRLMLVPESELTDLIDHRRAAAHWHLERRARAIPKLVSPRDAANIMGFAQGNWVRELYDRGELPGRRVGPDIVFRLQAATAFAAVRALSDQRHRPRDVR